MTMMNVNPLCSRKKLFTYIGDDTSGWERCVVGGGKDDGMIFCHRWVQIKNLPKLAGNQDQAITFI
jgi:8-oxo-dGTP diphosphatase